MLTLSMQCVHLFQAPDLSLSLWSPWLPLRQCTLLALHWLPSNPRELLGTLSLSCLSLNLVGDAGYNLLLWEDLEPEVNLIIRVWAL